MSWIIAHCAQDKIVSGTQGFIEQIRNIYAFIPIKHRKLRLQVLRTQEAPAGPDAVVTNLPDLGIGVGRSTTTVL